MISLRLNAREVFMPHSNYNLFGMPYYRKWDHFELPDLESLPQNDLVNNVTPVSNRQLIASPEADENDQELTYDEVFDYG